MYIDEEKLKEKMREAGYSSYEAVVRDAGERGIKLSIVTVYNIANNKNWTRDRVLALATTLDCKVEDFLVMDTPGPDAEPQDNEGGPLNEAEGVEDHEVGEPVAVV